jgi:hypothetical protein
MLDGAKAFARRERDIVRCDVVLQIDECLAANAVDLPECADTRRLVVGARNAFRTGHHDRDARGLATCGRTFAQRGGK